ncbi:FecR family protein [Sphingobium yanoikuyae]|uniref:FecR family protein n=1 Tax=Sphingobium yanoikuyae TaxID=13690 RepID=UPI0035B01C7E
MNDPGGDNDARRHAIEEQAIAWFMHIRSRPAGADQSDLEAWLGQSVEHREAYARAQRHFETSEILKSSARYGRQKANDRRLWMIGIGIAAALTLAIALGSTFRPSPRVEMVKTEAPNLPVMRAPRHEIRKVVLGDGSQLTLDASSRVEIAMTAKERRLRLLEGKARVAIAGDARPFFFEAGAGELSASSARFDVDLRGDGEIEVAVLSGDVELRSLMRPAVLRTGPQRIPAGQSFAYLEDSFAPSPLAKESTNYLDWPDGWADYSAVPLEKLILDANHYARKPIVLDDVDSGRRLVSGRFRITETDRFVERIASLFDMALVRKPDSLHLRKR